MIGQAEIAAAAARQRIAARDRVRVPLGREGVCTMRIDPTLYHNAVQSNRRVYGVRDIWTEPEFRRDMARRHPELATVTEPSRPTAGYGHKRVGGGDLERVATRFGRATRTVYR
jgi:hypothetical protein